MAKRASASAKLSTYAAKRDFTQTPEPPPRAPKKSSSKLTFCVQKHLATALHYDFRLEYEGVLLSWAVPKGPSLNPADKRMAMRTEDHPLEYGKFEGVIPSGYGAGIVVLWDRGTWEPEVPDVRAAMAKGDLKFRLHGEKLKGSWVLVRLRRPEQRESWLLIKHRDENASDRDIVAEAPASVKTGKDFAGVLASSKDRKEFLPHALNRGGQAGEILRQVIEEITADPKASAKNPPKRATPAAKTKVGKTASTVKAKSSARPATRAKRTSRKPAAKTSGCSDDEPVISNPDKVLFLEAKFTKSDLVDYYTRIAPLMLPHLRGRWVTLKRYPDGVDGKFFFERRCPKHRPDWVRTVRVELEQKAGSIDYCLIEDVRTLRWVANLAAIELHVPLARADDPLTPTAMVFDLDPGPPAGMKQCVAVALRLKAMLDRHGLQSLVKTSGSKGLHILVPLNTMGVTFEQTKAFARAAATALEQETPDQVVTSVSKSERSGKVFVDFSQNDSARTTVCVYSVRAREQPNISTPVEWEAISAKKSPPASALAADLRLKQDPFAEMLTLRQKLPAPMAAPRRSTAGSGRG
jgi:bifunctional non-homologous end joining protein LigD